MTETWQKWERRPPFKSKDGRTLYPVYALGAHGDKYEGGTIYVYSHDVEPENVENAPDRIGQLTWNRQRVQYLEVDPEWQRQGIASAMWQLGRDAEPHLKHTTNHRSRDGEAFIRAVDPDQAMPNYELDTQDDDDKAVPGFWERLTGFFGG